jgi:hypothetical protein
MQDYWVVSILIAFIGLILGACVAAIKAYLEFNYSASPFGRFNKHFYISITVFSCILVYYLFPNQLLQFTTSNVFLQRIFLLQDFVFFAIMTLAAIQSFRLVFQYVFCSHK